MFYEDLFRTGVRISPPPLDFAPQSEVDRAEVLLIKERKREYTTNQKGATSQQALGRIVYV